jgi:hypothetical protein
LNALKNEENRGNNAMFLMFLECDDNEENKGNNDAMRNS